MYLTLMLIASVSTFYTFHNEIIQSICILDCLGFMVTLLAILITIRILSHVVSYKMFRTLIKLVRIIIISIITIYFISITYTLMYVILHIARGLTIEATVIVLILPWIFIIVVLKRWWKYLFIYRALLITILLTISYFITAVVLTESLYPQYINGYKVNYGDTCSIVNAWNITIKYFNEYYFTYGKPDPKPRQIFLIMYDWKYLLVYRRLEVIARTGTCEDFAIGLTTLIKDTLGCEVRVVAFKGWDHTVPEVKVDNTWYVFDIGYTTPNKPVEVNEYFKYLQTSYPDIAFNIQDFIDRETGKSLGSEHGLIIK